MHRLVVALVALLGLAAGGVVASYFFLSGVTDRAASLAPSNAAFYLNVYLQPSTGQQMNLSGLIGRLPGFADAATLDAKVDQVVQSLLSGTGIDYATEVKPWLGDQIAVAGWPSDGDPSGATTVVMAAVKDRAAAEAAVADLAAGGTAFSTEAHAGVDVHVAEGSAYAFVDDLLLVSPSATGIEAVIDVGGGAESLADRSDFREAMARIPSDHLASAFFDLAALVEAGGVEGQFGSFSTASAALVAERDGLRLSGSAPFDIAVAAESARDRFAMGTEPSSLVEWMPEDTVAEAVVFGLRQTLEDAETAIGSTGGGEDALGLLDTVRAIAAFGLGIDLDREVLPLLDREVGIALSDLDGALPRGQLLLRPDDAEAATAALELLAERLEAVGATTRTESRDGVDVTILTLPDTGDVAYAIVDGIVILGFSADDVMAAVSAHASGASLAATDAYAQTFEVAGQRAGTEAFVDIGRLWELRVLDDAAADLPSDARDILGALGTFGVTVPSRDDQIEFHAVMTVPDRNAE
jgi:hypothetical protein